MIPHAEQMIIERKLFSYCRKSRDLKSERNDICSPGGPSYEAKTGNAKGVSDPTVQKAMQLSKYDDTYRNDREWIKTIDLAMANLGSVTAVRVAKLYYFGEGAERGNAGKVGDVMGYTARTIINYIHEIKEEVHKSAIQNGLLMLRERRES